MTRFEMWFYLCFNKLFLWWVTGAISRIPNTYIVSKYLELSSSELLKGPSLLDPQKVKLLDRKLFRWLRPQQKLERRHYNIFLIIFFFFFGRTPSSIMQATVRRFRQLLIVRQNVLKWKEKYKRSQGFHLSMKAVFLLWCNLPLGIELDSHLVNTEFSLTEPHARSAPGRHTQSKCRLNQGRQSWVVKRAHSWIPLSLLQFISCVIKGTFLGLRFLICVMEIIEPIS